jgi:hypothetical protein
MSAWGTGFGGKDATSCFAANNERNALENGFPRRRNKSLHS